MIRIGSVRGRPGFNSQLGSIFLFSFGAIALLRWLMFLLVERQQSAKNGQQYMHIPIAAATFSNSASDEIYRRKKAAFA